METELLDLERKVQNLGSKAAPFAKDDFLACYNSVVDLITRSSSVESRAVQKQGLGCLRNLNRCLFQQNVDSGSTLCAQVIKSVVHSLLALDGFYATSNMVLLQIVWTSLCEVPIKFSQAAKHVDFSNIFGRLITHIQCAATKICSPAPIATPIFNQQQIHLVIFFVAKFLVSLPLEN